MDADQFNHALAQHPQHIRYLESLRDKDATTIGIYTSEDFDLKDLQDSSEKLSLNYPGRFTLVEQPNVRQRKSYKNENR